MTLQLSKVQWAKSHRLIPSQYPPIDLFDDIAPPEDWEALARAESRTNPRIYEQIGNLDAVPVERRVSNSWGMSAFTHYSPDWPSRFTDGLYYGVYYCANSLETSLLETSYHKARFFAATKEEEGWTLTMRELVAKIDYSFHDIRTGDFAEILAPDDHSAGQAFARKLRNEGSDGIVYPSIRHSGGECLAAFWPDVIGKPQQGGHWSYHWDGERFDYVKKLDDKKGTVKVLKL